MNLLRTVILASGFWLSAFFLSACKDDSMSAGPIGEVEQGKQPIAACGAAMLPHGLLLWKDRLRGRHAVWFCDSTSALHSVVK